MIYKPEIDGLRGIAVLLVLLTHMQLGMTGGFIGVDVFFVISGYLITAIVLNGITQQKFSFIEFYSKRFVRLYPALIVIVIITFIAGLMLADPVMLKNLVRSGKYVLWSASNIYFSKHQGYFDVGADQQVFLHTWSLGVEWQFYLIWPVLMWLALKISKRFLVILLALITLGSLIASQIMVTLDAVNAYYQMPSRAFELGIGGLLVFIYGRTCKPLYAVLLTCIGLVLIIYPAYVYLPSTPFPGLAAFWPCLGAALCIYGAKGFNYGNVLQLSPLVYVGKISYSVYLVHWPLLVFYSYYIFRPLNLSEKLALFTISLGLGAMLYHGIETRINWRKLKRRNLAIALMFAILFLLTPVFHYISKGGQGLPQRLGENAELFSVEYVEGGSPSDHSETRFGAKDGRLIAFLTGDSFAAQYRTGFNTVLEPLGEYIEAFYSFGCLIAPPYEKFGPPSAQRQICNRIYEKVIEAVNANNLPLILSQDWRLYYDYNAIDYNEQSHFANEDAFLAFIPWHLAQLKEAIADNKLILLSLPNYYRNHFNAADCLLRPNYLPQICNRQIYQPYAPEDSLAGRVNDVLREFAATHDGVYFIDLTALVCPNGLCTVEYDIKLYNDGRHFSRNGSRIAARGILTELQQILNN